MTVVGFHASHEQVHPHALLDAVQRAEQAGFTAAMSLRPLLAVERAAGPQRVRLVVARRRAGHDAVCRSASSTRPASATTRRSSPRPRPRSARCSPAGSGSALGTGEASNEHITGDRWPRKAVRNARLRECVDVIRAPARRRGGQPRRPRDASTGPASGRYRTSRRRCSAPRCRPRPRAGSRPWADGLVTVNQPVDRLRGGARRLPRGRRARSGRRCRCTCRYASDDDDALRIAHDQWRTNVVQPTDLLGPRDRRAVRRRSGERVRPDDVRGVGARLQRPGRHAAWMHELADLGFDARLPPPRRARSSRTSSTRSATEVLPQLDVTAP